MCLPSAKFVYHCPINQELLSTLASCSKTNFIFVGSHPPPSILQGWYICDNIFMVITSAFWLNGHLDPACVSDSNCEPSDIRWEDEGPVFNASIYEGWMGIKIDNRERSCLMVQYLHQ